MNHKEINTRLAKLMGWEEKENTGCYFSEDPTVYKGETPIEDWNPHQNLEQAFMVIERLRTMPENHGKWFWELKATSSGLFQFKIGKRNFPDEQHAFMGPKMIDAIYAALAEVIKEGEG